MAQPAESAGQRLQDLLAFADKVVEGLIACDPEQIILYGSVAREQVHQSSDVDLLVVKESDKGFWERHKEVDGFVPRSLPQDPGGGVDVKVYTPAQFERGISVGSPFLESALGDGKVVYERSSGLRQAATAPRTKWAWDGGIRFVRQPVRAARQWLNQAEENLDHAQKILQLGSWSFVCFHSQQAAELGLKAFLYLKGHPPILEYRIEELAKRCAAEDSGFSEFMTLSVTIGNYYITTRYPRSDNISDEPPARMFNEAQAREALDYAERIVNLVQARVSEASQNSEGPANNHAEQP